MKKISLLFLGLVLIFTACNKDPQPSLEIPQEAMDKVHFVFVAYDENNQLGMDTLLYSYTIFDERETEIVLEKGRKYLFFMEIFNVEEKVHEEIKEEGEEHQFFFFVELEDIFTSFAYADEDKEGNAIGLKNIIEVNNQELSSIFQIVLRHGLDKNHSNAQNYNDFNYRNAGGSDDLNLTLTIHSREF